MSTVYVHDLNFITKMFITDAMAMITKTSNKANFNNL